MPRENASGESDIDFNLEYSQRCNNTTILLHLLPNEWDDATWILTSAFVIFTMQSGFGLLESGTATLKNEVNIMVKNAVDVIYGGFTYWMFGYAFSFGNDPGSNAFCGFGGFFYQANDTEMGKYSDFVFHASFATTATTIVSGAMVERTRLEAYIAFSFVNTLVFSFPSHWVWAHNGFLNVLGVLDIAGGGPVHVAGGVTGLVATIFLKPRHRRYSSTTPPPMGSPTNAILGMFMLWWGWLGFNCGSTNGITSNKWKLAARSAVSTILSSMAGGIIGITLSYVTKRRKFDVGYIINGILGSLVSITAICAAAHPWESFVVGSIGGVIACGGIELLNKLKIDDPVGVVPVHAMCGAWSLVAGGIFGRQIEPEKGPDGLIATGNFYLLGVQSLAVVCIGAWCALTSCILLTVIHCSIGLRLTLDQEILGSDLVEHSIGSVKYDKIKRRIVNDSNQNDVQEGSIDVERDTTNRARRSWHNAFQKISTFQRYARAAETKPVRPEEILINVFQNKSLGLSEREDSAGDEGPRTTVLISGQAGGRSQSNGNVVGKQRKHIDDHTSNSVVTVHNEVEKGRSNTDHRKLLAGVGDLTTEIPTTYDGQDNLGFENDDADRISQTDQPPDDVTEECTCPCNCGRLKQRRWRVLPADTTMINRGMQKAVVTVSVSVQTDDLQNDVCFETNHEETTVNFQSDSNSQNSSPSQAKTSQSKSLGQIPTGTEIEVDINLNETNETTSL
ncbi:putative ammonium transporter 2 [Ptychodera flava]|uniref:putative ammonium transporter 2 n=1 Tax=Ptychodera flava TaxID=63121 RepID=UPI003969C0B2